MSLPLETHACIYDRLKGVQLKAKKVLAKNIVYSSSQVSQDNCQLKPKKQHSPGKNKQKNKKEQNLHNLIFFFFYILLLFFNLLLAALGLCCCARAFSSCGERGLLFVVVHRRLIAVASLVAKHGL